MGNVFLLPTLSLNLNCGIEASTYPPYKMPEKFVLQYLVIMSQTGHRWCIIEYPLDIRLRIECASWGGHQSKMVGFAIALPTLLFTTFYDFLTPIYNLKKDL